MRWAFFGVIAGVAFAGCSLVVDTNGLSGGLESSAEGGGRTDAPVNVPEGGSRDGGGEASSDSGLAATCPTDALLCIDFENGFGPLEPHAADPNKVETVTDIVHSGTHAFRAESHVRDGGASNNADLRLLLQPPLAPGDTIFFRAWVYLPIRLPPETTISKWRSSGTEDMNLKLDDTGRLKVDADLTGEGPELSGVDVAPIGQWFCVDWRATLGALPTTGHELLNMNGVKQIDANEKNISPHGYVSIGLGFVTQDIGGDEVVYFDDVIISKTLVGCP